MALSLKIKAFQRRGENAVRAQMVVALITYVMADLFTKTIESLRILTERVMMVLIAAPCLIAPTSQVD